MKKIFTLSLFLFSINIFAQPVITSLYNPNFGDTMIYKIVDDTATAQPGQGGAGVVWNLSSMHGQLTTRQYNWKQTALTNDAITFSANSNITAEIIQNGFSTQYEFYHVGANYTGDMKRVGTHIDFAITNFYAGYTQFDYPISFGQSSTDTMIGSNGVAYVNGRITTTYDGYGTLQLESQSGGNFSNVARIKVEENYIVNYGPIETHHVVTYYWMDHTTVNMTKQPIAIISTHDWVDLNGLQQRQKIALIRQILFLNGLPQQTLTSSNVSVSPNPFNDKITLSLPGINSEITVAICDITGRVIKEFHFQKSAGYRDETILLPGIREGIYLAKISSEKGTVIKRIVKD